MRTIVEITTPTGDAVEGRDEDVELAEEYSEARTGYILRKGPPLDNMPR